MVDHVAEAGWVWVDVFAWVAGTIGDVAATVSNRMFRLEHMLKGRQ